MNGHNLLYFERDELLRETVINIAFIVISIYCRIKHKNVLKVARSKNPTENQISVDNKVE